MILAFLIISLVIWTLSVIVNIYTISQQSKTSEVSIMTIVSLIINLAMVTMNIVAMSSL